MTTAFVKIHSFINSLKDDEVIRATDQKLSAAELKKDKNAEFDNNKGATHLYVRSGFFSKLRQALTNSTDGAMQKQHLAKELIIKTLDKLPDDLKSNDSVKQSIKNITDTLKNNELKDFTAGMIRKDLDVINNAFKFKNVNANPLYESNPVNPLYRGKSKEPDPAKSAAGNAVVQVSPAVKANAPATETKEPFVLKLKNEEISGGNVTEPEFNEILEYFGFNDSDELAKKAVMNLANEVMGKGSKEILNSGGTISEGGSIGDDKHGEVLNSESKSQTPSVSKKITAEEQEKKLDGLFKRKKLGQYSTQENNTNTKSNDVTPANLTASIEVEEVVLNSLDHAVDGKPAEHTNSSLAESTPTINITPAPIGEAIEQDIDASEATTESTPSPAPSATSSTAETKSNATDNPYLESLNTKWSASDNGYFEVSKPFYITGEMPTSKMLAQAYLLSEGKKLEFIGKKGEASKSSENQVVHAEHELRDDLDLANEKRGTRPYLKLEVKLESKPFQSSTKVAQSPAVLRLAEEYKKSLITIYTDSVQKISDEYKKTNSGKELETLVIAPITSTDGILLEVESTALVSAIKEIQIGNPGLKIAISADKESHSDAIRAAYER